MKTFLAVLAFSAFLMGAGSLTAQVLPGEGDSCGTCEKSTCPDNYRLLTPTAGGEYANIYFFYCERRDNCNFAACTSGGDDLVMLNTIFSPESPDVNLALVETALINTSGRLRLEADGSLLLMSCDQREAIRRISLTPERAAEANAVVARAFASIAFVAFGSATAE